MLNDPIIIQINILIIIYFILSYISFIDFDFIFVLFHETAYLE